MTLSEIVKAHEFAETLNMQEASLLSNGVAPLAHIHRAALIQMVKDRDALLKECKSYVEYVGLLSSDDYSKNAQTLLKRLEEI